LTKAAPVVSFGNLSKGFDYDKKLFVKQRNSQ